MPHGVVDAVGEPPGLDPEDKADQEWRMASVLYAHHIVLADDLAFPPLRLLSCAIAVDWSSGQEFRPFSFSNLARERHFDPPRGLVIVVIDWSLNHGSFGVEQNNQHIVGFSIDVLTVHDLTCDRATRLLG